MGGIVETRKVRFMRCCSFTISRTTKKHESYMKQSVSIYTYDLKCMFEVV